MKVIFVGCFYGLEVGCESLVLRIVRFLVWKDGKKRVLVLRWGRLRKKLVVRKGR